MLEEWMRSYRPDELFDEGGLPTTDGVTPAGDLRMSASLHAGAGADSSDLVLRDFRQYDVLTVSDRAFMESLQPGDERLSHEGRVMEVLSEHNCHGWLEGYTLTGRHGLFATYEAFAMVSASQTVQHSRWLEESLLLPWRAAVPSLNVLLTSTAWRNDHNGFSHQGPGVIQVMLIHRAEVTRIYLPPDANCLLSVADHCFRSRDYVNLIVIDKQPQLQYLGIEDVAAHCAAGAGIWEWAGHEDGAGAPDIVLACAGDTPTLATVAAAQILRERLPELRTRVVNVVDLMVLPRPTDHPHGLPVDEFTRLFTDVVFAFHGFPGAVHQLVHGRPGADELRRWCFDELARHAAYVREHMEDLPEIREWRVDAGR